MLTADACRAWLAKLVTKLAPPARRARQPTAPRAALIEAESAPVQPCAVLTWNINGVLQAKSAQAPADERAWPAADNLDAVQAEVLRWRPDVFSLQECRGAAGFERFGAAYDFVGARAGHDP